MIQDFLNTRLHSGIDCFVVDELFDVFVCKFNKPFLSRHSFVWSVLAYCRKNDFEVVEFGGGLFCRKGKRIFLRVKKVELK